MACRGREQELARSAGAIARAAAGAVARVAVSGPAGIGVSTLLDALVAQVAPLPGIVVARGTARVPAALEPWQAIGDALAGALADLPADRVRAVAGDAAYDLVHVLPDGGAILRAHGIADTPPALAAPDQVGTRVAEAVLSAFERLAGDGCVVLVIDDLQHADPATLAFLRTLLRLDRPVPVCPVVAWQPEAIGRRHPARALTDQLLADAATENVVLGPLDPAALELLACDLRGGPVPGDLLAAVIAGADGLPLAAVQLLAAQAGGLGGPSGAWCR